jgi:hypothetical protein
VNGLTELHRFDWNGILLEITYEPEWLPPHILGEDVAHVQVQSIYPTDAPLPITETGYRSHFIAAATIVAAGGPVAYVDVWLTAESQAPAWRQREQAARQFSLL